MTKKFLVLKDFSLIKKTGDNVYKAIDPNSNFGSAKLVMRIIKAPKNDISDFACAVSQGSRYCQDIKYPEYYFREQVAVLNPGLSDQLANQINSIIDQINAGAENEDQARAMFCRIFDMGSLIGGLSVINDFVEDYRNYSMESLFPVEFFPDYKFISYKKYSFCGNNPNAMTSDPYEFLFRTMFFSICSWKISDTTPLLDQKKFFISIIFSVYDQWQQKYFEIKLNVTTPLWIAEEIKKQPLTFFRHILIQEYFDFDIVKHHIYRTLIHSKAQDNPRFYSSAVREIGFGFELPEEYIEIGQHC